ncbi:MAG: hypothetical protein JKY08_08005 [Flavobacteriaceae bacterium]|nr:hypothetical protein [Flavobacteriaceae bacterium]
MQITFTEEHIPYVKKWLRDALPDIKATDRLQALARSLGFKSYEALLFNLNQNKLQFKLDSTLFIEYLSNRGHLISDRLFARVIMRTLLEAILQKETNLTTHGFGIPNRNGLTGEKYRDEFTKSIFEFYHNDYCDQLQLALIFLQASNKIKTINKKRSTYNLKHSAENLSREYEYNTQLGNYVSNGVFIAGCHIEAFTVKRVSWNSLNGYINISNRSVKALSNSKTIEKLIIIEKHN